MSLLSIFSARERNVNYINGQRQANVNYGAESIGRSSGTFRRDGVPGTGVGGRAYGFAYGGDNTGIYNGGYNKAFPQYDFNSYHG